MIKAQSKIECRKIAKEIRVSLAQSGLIDVKSSRIVSKILNSKEFIDARHIALYYPIKNEINLLGLLNLKGKNFYFPKTVGNELEFVKYIDEQNMIEGKFGEKIPQGKSIDPQILDIIYIPALMANRNNFRLGYGKGYYDRFLKHNAQHSLKYIVVAQELISSDFIEDEFDYKCHGIISA